MGVRGGYAGDFTVLADLMGEDCVPSDDYNQISEVSRFQYTKSSDNVKNYYRRFYYSIARINKVLEIIRKKPLDENIDVQLGELYALRAMFHFDLARMFAKLPSNAAPNDLGIVIAKKTFSGSDTGLRSTIKDTYDAILTDLDTAFTYLPEVPTMGGLQTGHMNFWSTKALRSRIYLYMEENSLALSDAQYVIDNSPYSLYTIGEYVDAWEKQGKRESLMEFLVTTFENAQRNSLGFYSSPDGYAEFGISKSFYDNLTARTQDVRSKLLFEQDWGDGMIVYFQNKYPGRDKDVYVNNPKVIRLSEVYLIAAEAALKSGEGDAVDYINDLRRNRIEGYSDVTSITLDDILMERRLELFSEGHMAWDAWRNKKPVNNPTIGEVKYDDTRTILPIPLSEINISGGKLQQNSGY